MAYKIHASSAGTASRLSHVNETCNVTDLALKGFSNICHHQEEHPTAAEPSS